MKKTVTVTIRKDIELDIPDHLLTLEHLTEFSAGIFEVNNANSLICFVARQVFDDATQFVEGMGKVGGPYAKERGEVDIAYSIQYEEYEILIDGETHYD